MTIRRISMMLIVGAMSFTLPAESNANSAAVGVRTVVSMKTPVYAFAQDRGHMVWETSDPRCGRTVLMRTVMPGGAVSMLTTPKGATCDGDVDYWAPEVAIAGSSAVWETGIAGFSHVDVEVYVGSPGTNDRPVDLSEVEFDPQTSEGPSFEALAGPVAGQGSVLAYVVGGIVGLVGGKTNDLVGLSEVTALATDGSRLAVVQTRSTHRAQVVIQGGATIVTVSPTAIALSGGTLAALIGSRINLYGTASGKVLRSVHVSALSAPSISLSGTRLVFAVREQRNSAIEILDTQTGHVTKLALASGKPIGLSIIDNRVSWAENSNGHGRIKAIELG